MPGVQEKTVMGWGRSGESQTSSDFVNFVMVHSLFPECPNVSRTGDSGCHGTGEKTKPA
jgi:hypothetical protein